MDSFSHNDEYDGREAVELTNSTVTVSGSGALNAGGGDSLRTVVQSKPISGGNGIWLQKGSTLVISGENATLNSTD